jgi:hypothetical protein
MFLETSPASCKALMAFGLGIALALDWQPVFYSTSLEKQRSVMKKRIRRLRFSNLLASYLFTTYL